MKKIMFNDRYGLTQAVLNGTKTMTRRIIEGNYPSVTAYHANGSWHFIADTEDGDAIALKPKYEIGETVAVAQPYKVTHPKSDFEMVGNNFMTESAGWNNKMFVKANLMPDRIRITDIKVERLQDISDEDCIREGIVQDYDGVDSYSFSEPATLRFSGKDVFRRCTYAETPKAAFTVLIDKVSGKGTWERNPWVFAYEFELCN